MYNFDEDVVTDKVTPDECINYYSKQPSRYDHDVELSNYKGPEEVVTTITQFNPPLDKSLKILDICAGTGRLAKMLKAHGFNNIEGLDGSAGMLQEAVVRNIYTKSYVCLIKPTEKLPVDDDSYDLLTASGAFAPGHLYSDSIPVLLRALKSGGMMIWAMREGYEKTSPLFVNFDPTIKALEEEGKVKLVDKRPIPLYLYQDPGFVYVLQKLSN